MKRTLSVLVCLVLILSFSTSLAGEAPLRVMTSFYPLHIFAQNILSGVAGVVLSNLTHPTTGCLHDYQLLAGDMKLLAQTDVLFINGGGMEPFLDIVAEQFEAIDVVDTSVGIDLISAMTLLDEHADDEEEHNEDDGHDHGEYNAHIWLDPQNAIRMSANMASALRVMLPHAAAQIDQNLADYTQRLTALDLELQDTLLSLARRDIVTFHEAFPYFAKAYGLHVVAVLALETDEALTPQMLSALVEKVVQAGLPPLFTEPQFDDKAARAVAQETGASVFELDPIVTGDGNPLAYEQGMRSNAQVLLKALGTP